MNTTDSATTQAEAQDVVLASLDIVAQDLGLIEAIGGKVSSPAARDALAHVARIKDMWAKQSAPLWRPMGSAPEGDRTAVIDIWDGERRIPDCFWHEGFWCYEEFAMGEFRTIRITEPKAWMPTPAAPEGF